VAVAWVAGESANSLTPYERGKAERELIATNKQKPFY
jgi:hypothetical protein